MLGAVFVKDSCCCIRKLWKKNPITFLWTECPLPISKWHRAQPLITAFLLYLTRIFLWHLTFPPLSCGKQLWVLPFCHFPQEDWFFFISVYKSRLSLTFHNSCHELSVPTSTLCSIKMNPHLTTDIQLFVQTCNLVLKLTDVAALEHLNKQMTKQFSSIKVKPSQISSPWGFQCPKRCVVILAQMSQDFCCHGKSQIKSFR